MDNVVQAKRNRNVHNLVINQHVANEANAVSEHESQSEYGSDSDDKWMGCKESVQEVNEMFHDEEDIDFKVFDSGTDLDNEGQEFANSQWTWLLEHDGSSNTDGPSEDSGSIKSNKGTTYSGNLKSKKGSKYSNGCPWVLQCSKLKNKETWKVKRFNDNFDGLLLGVKRKKSKHNCKIDVDRSDDTSGLERLSRGFTSVWVL
ncbi:hypothetical protein Tco_1151817 [Tanacetum coccineum]